jgi:hypothetical protein
LGLVDEGESFFDFGDEAGAAVELDVAEADVAAAAEFSGEGENAVFAPDGAGEGGADAGEARIAADPVVPSPDGDGLAGGFDHEAGGEDGVAGKVEREDPVVGEVHFGVDRFVGDLEDAVDLEHLLDGEVDLGEIGAGVEGRVQEGAVMSRGKRFYVQEWDWVAAGRLKGSFKGLRVAGFLVGRQKGTWEGPGLILRRARDDRFLGEEPVEGGGFVG